MKYTVLGAAKSGLAAALLAHRLGHTVFVSEYKPEEAYPDAATQLRNAHIPVEFGGHTERALDCDCIITSPGIKPTVQIIQDAEAKEIPIISELEFASQHCKNPIIAITGTNGKTTTTALITHVFNHSGRK
ncbi:MAG: UDP-N-acetylmuramoyl-L-alanine--D-glutamate ligase, partial [Candidatus Kapabacteria bacterium]|nr:UDP-N-acetylmuramoyl-L-alanine--D-glutamate ligase [Candidatus Kapabacteria bacterium]